MATARIFDAACVALALACHLGCGHNSAPIETETAVTSLPASDRAPQVETRWYACNEGKATKALIAEVTIPSVCERARQEVFLISDTTYGENGLRKWPIVFPATMYACGRSGAFHESVGVGWDPPDAEHLILELHYFWIIRDWKKEGSLDEKVKVRVGEPKRVTFENGAFVEVTWRDVAHK